jgi:enhancer of polycomb-like protein
MLTHLQEYHLQQVMKQGATTAGLGEKTQQSFIPTPDATKAKGIEYDKLYPKVFSSPATYIRFSSTVEESIGVPYCMDDEDVAVRAKLNTGKDFEGNNRKDKLSNCSEDAFEEVMSFFEETCSRLQPFADIDKSPVPTFDEMEQNIDENLSLEAQKWLKLIYPHWQSRKNSKAIMPTVKLRLLDNTSEADDADPYVCFRRREVRQTRKTRGRDAQIVEKLKKLRLELEQARTLVQFVNQREQLNKQSLETSRKVFEERGELKKVKSERGIIGEKGEDEELLVNQRVRRPLLTDIGEQLTDLSTACAKTKSTLGHDRRACANDQDPWSTSSKHRSPDHGERAAFVGGPASRDLRSAREDRRYQEAATPQLEQRLGRQDLATHYPSSRVDRRTTKVGVFTVAARRIVPYAATYAAFRRLAERWRY